MGQARKRGTFEERKAEGIIEEQKRQAARAEAALEREKNMSPAQRRRRVKAQMLVAAMVGITGMAFGQPQRHEF